MTPPPLNRPACPKCGASMRVVRTRLKAGRVRIQSLGCRPCKYWTGGCLPVDNNTELNAVPVVTNSHDMTEGINHASDN